MWADFSIVVAEAMKKLAQRFDFPTIETIGGFMESGGSEGYVVPVSGAWGVALTVTNSDCPQSRALFCLRH